MTSNRLLTSEYRTALLDDERAYKEFERLVHDAAVLELGPGKWGGLAQDVIRAGARSYVGIEQQLDIINDREGTYVLDDVAHALDVKVFGSYVSVSTGFFDTRVLGDATSIERITRALASKSPRGFHWIAPDDDGTIEHAFRIAGYWVERVSGDMYRIERNA